MKILLIGVDGKSGNSILEFFMKTGIAAGFADEKDLQAISPVTQSLIQKFPDQELKFFGEDLENPSGKLATIPWDLIILAPGVPRRKKFIQDSLAKKIPIWSEIEFAFNLNSNPLLGITGTDGKSTTTVLTAFLLNQLGISARACGNIGLPFIDVAATNAFVQDGARFQVDAERELPDSAPEEGTVPVVELSSYQLESVDKFIPVAGALLNISEDHLDRYESMTGYIGAKLNLFKRGIGAILVRQQELNDFAIIKNYLAEKQLNGVTYSYQSSASGLDLSGKSLPSDMAGCFYYRGEDLFLKTRDKNQGEMEIRFPSLLRDFPLSGLHNQENLAFSVMLIFFYLHNTRQGAMAQDLKSFAGSLGIETWWQKVSAFRGLPHRFEILGDFNGIEVINDSKATTFQATQSAVFSRPRGQVILIAGGRAKGANMNHFAEKVAPWLKVLICIGETTNEMHRIFSEIQPDLPIIDIRSMTEAVESSLAFARKGDVVLLSPGCASFDMFRNFEERGDVFKKVAAENFLLKRENLG